MSEIEGRWGFGRKWYRVGVNFILDMVEGKEGWVVWMEIFKVYYLEDGFEV